MRQVKAFIGLASYYRTLIPGLSVVARPLFRLLRKDVPWHWGPAEEAAYVAIKRALTTGPVVRGPDWSRPVYHYTDYCLSAVGAVLSQKDDEGREYHRTVGFLPPEEFIPELMLANGKVYLQNGRTARARRARRSPPAGPRAISGPICGRITSI